MHVHVHYTYVYSLTLYNMHYSWHMYSVCKCHVYCTVELQRPQRGHVRLNSGQHFRGTGNVLCVMVVVHHTNHMPEGRGEG